MTGAPPAGRPMVMELSPRIRDRIRKFAIEANLAERARRPLLLHGIPPALAASLPVVDRPIEQLVSDVIELARQPTDAGDSLSIWLENASEMCIASVHGSALKRLASRRRRETETDVDRLTRELAEARAAGAQIEDIRALEVQRVEARRRQRDGGEPTTGDVLDDADLILGKPLGDGAYARVWQAWDPKRQMPVAVRILRAGWSRDASHRARFYRGARTMARFEHPGIVPIHSIADDNAEFPYLTMALMRQNLKERVLNGGLGPADGLVHIAQVAGALAHLHAAGVSHRDVKPGNILIDADGMARLGDFDLVRAPGTTGGTRGGAGTAIYAAPELMHDASTAGPPADVYGLAMTANFVLSRRALPAYMMREPYSLLPSLPCGDRLRSVLRRCLDMDPGVRPSAREVADAISETGEHALTPGKPRADGPPDWALGLLLDQPRRLILVRRARLLVYRGLHCSLSQPAFEAAVDAVTAMESGVAVERLVVERVLAEIDPNRVPDLADALSGRGIEPLTAEMCIVIE